MGIFITVHLAIFGGIIYVDRPLRNAEKIASLIIYTAFAIFNYRIMKTQMVMMQKIYIEIDQIANQPCCTANEVLAFMSAELASGRFEWALWFLGATHVVMYTLVVLSIVFDRALNLGGSKKSSM